MSAATYWNKKDMSKRKKKKKGMNNSVQWVQSKYIEERAIVIKKSRRRKIQYQNLR